MPDVNQVYQSEFLRADQLKGEPRRVTVEAATVEVLGQGEKAQQKIVLKFRSVRQRLPLNKTNALFLSATWGPDTGAWIGKALELRPERVLFAGNMVAAIRVGLPAAPVAKAETAVDALRDITDDLPWAGDQA